MAKKVKIKNSSDSTKVKLSPIARLKSKPIITNDVMRATNKVEVDSLRRKLDVKVEIKK